MNARPIATLMWLAVTAGWAAACGAHAQDPVEPPVQTTSRRPILCYVETLFAGVTADDLDFRPCTHVIDAFLVVDQSGAIRATNGLPRRDLMAAARRAGARVMVAVGGATVSGATFTAIARDQTRRAQFARTLSNFVAEAGYDGVDLDWEFPSPSESNLHLDLVRAVKLALSTRAARPVRTRPLRPVLGPAGSVIEAEAAPIVTVPIAAYWIPSFNLAALHDEVDYVTLMGYDFRNPALGPWAHDTTLWPVDSRAPIEASVRGAASEMIRNGLGFDKLVIAFPFYTSDQQPWVEVRERALASPSPLHPLFLEKLIDGVWVTDPEALEQKVRAAIAGYQINNGNAVGIAVWQLGHQGPFRDLTEAILRATGPP